MICLDSCQIEVHQKFNITSTINGDFGAKFNIFGYDCYIASNLPSAHQSGHRFPSKEKEAADLINFTTII